MDLLLFIILIIIACALGRIMYVNIFTENIDNSPPNFGEGDGIYRYKDKNDERRIKRAIAKDRLRGKRRNL